MPSENTKGEGLPKVLLNEVQYQDLHFYQKSEVLYALTFHFTRRFLPASGDRTVDQMVQAARSGKQCNIALTLLHMTDKMMKTYMTGLEQQFVTQGGIKERMHAARTGYRKGIDEELQRLRIENQDLQRLREENKRLRQQVPILEQRIESMECEKRHLQVLLTQERDKVR